MADFSFSWQMDDMSAKRLVKKQFFRYYFLKYVVCWVLFAESLLWILVPLNNRTFVLWIAAAIIVGNIVYIVYYKNMLPDKQFRADYTAEFYKDKFVITGKRYKRAYTYSQIDKWLNDGKDIYILTCKEGVIIPMEAFSVPGNRGMFVKYVQEARNGNF